jgi:crotonobetainyl-CoA:carnitine CoA-transferase CaiB-like acyl-CoA transferase
VVTRPLEGIRVIDVTRMLAGPFASLIMADLGADVIKVESSNGGDPTRHFAPYHNGESHYFLSLHRNKRSVALDLHQPKGVEVLRSLIDESDVFLENYRPSILADLGLAPSVLRANHPELIVCSISGYGHSGPLMDRPAFDLVVQAMAGIMSINGEREGPPTRLGLPMGDLIGGLYGVIAVLGALRTRDQSGEGQEIDLSLHDGLLSLLGYMGGYYFASGETPPRVGSGHAAGAPYNSYEVRDGYIVIASLIDTFWPRLCHAIGRDDLLANHELDTSDGRARNRDLVDKAVQDAFSEMTVENACKLLDEADVPCSPVLSVADALTHPQVEARSMIAEFTHPVYGSFRSIANPVKIAGARDVVSAPPTLGEHTDEVLLEAGYKSDEIDALREIGAVK